MDKKKKGNHVSQFHMGLNDLSLPPPPLFPLYTQHRPFLIWPWTGRTPATTTVCWRTTQARQSPLHWDPKTHSLLVQQTYMQDTPLILLTYTHPPLVHTNNPTAAMSPSIECPSITFSMSSAKGLLSFNPLTPRPY